MLYRVDAAGRLPILALDSATAPGGVAVAPSTWTPAPGSTFGVAAKQFRLVAPAPAADWVAWESAGAVHDLLGLVPGHGGNIVVLDFFFDSSAGELLWAPAGRYLAALYEPPSGYPELRLYDAQTGTKLVPAWTAECRAQDACQVKSAQWTGPTTIAVKTSARAYQTDVSQLK